MSEAIREKIIAELDERRDIELDIQSCEEKIKELDGKIEAARQLKGISFDSFGGGSGGISNATGEAALSIVSEYEPSLVLERDELRKLLAKLKEIDMMIYSLSGKYRRVVLMRHADGKFWKEVGKSMGCSATSAKRLYRDSIDILVRIREAEPH